MKVKPIMPMNYSNLYRVKSKKSLIENKKKI